MPKASSSTQASDRAARAASVQNRLTTRFECIPTNEFGNRKELLVALYQVVQAHRDSFMGSQLQWHPGMTDMSLTTIVITDKDANPDNIAVGGAKEKAREKTAGKGAAGSVRGGAIIDLDIGKNTTYTEVMRCADRINDMVDTYLVTGDPELRETLEEVEEYIVVEMARHGVYDCKMPFLPMDF
ncbi:hypothetical protein PLICRDRAFT_176584 [Plicaturopsis crispa FD-325 SS-3]|nr:hypothetical protein PLICRDRAFT_176584 [Plicaturopsis crispa FD-325 SS-3]